jgi:hypothetical protein
MGRLVWDDGSGTMQLSGVQASAGLAGAPGRAGRGAPKRSAPRGGRGALVSAP